MKTPPLNLVSSFLAFSNAKNMIEAAATLGLSQSALTVHLQDFEGYFKMKVFAMEGRKKILTPFGLELRTLFMAKLAHLDNEIDDVNRRFSRPEDISIRISGRTEIINYLAREISLSSHLVFKGGEGQVVVQDLLDKETDFAISNHLEKADNLISKKLFSDEFFIAVPKKWAKGHDTLSKELLLQLLEKPFLQYKEEDAILARLLSHFKLTTSKKAKVVLADWTSLMHLAAREDGWVVAPTRYKNLLTKDLVSMGVPVTILPRTDFYILYRRENFDRDWLLPTLEKIKDVFKDVR